MEIPRHKIPWEPFSHYHTSMCIFCITLTKACRPSCNPLEFVLLVPQAIYRISIRMFWNIDSVPAIQRLGCCLHITKWRSSIKSVIILPRNVLVIGIIKCFSHYWVKEATILLPVPRMPSSRYRKFVRWSCRLSFFRGHLKSRSHTLLGKWLLIHAGIEVSLFQ